MLTAYGELKRILDDIPAKLLSFSEEEASVKPLPHKWSKKEILGHLIDSASNNHQRFVRMQIDNHLQLSEYRQDEWVATQQYQQRKWSDIVALWKLYNTHLLHILQFVNETKLSHTETFPENRTKTLQFLIDDYIVHMKHHLKQIFPNGN